MNIGESIKALRIKVAATQVEFASSVGITQNYLSQVENGHKTPSIEVLEKIAASVDVPLPVLFWFSIERRDVAEGKQDAYDSLKESIDNMIFTYFGKI